jgi:hypothetical protein
MTTHDERHDDSAAKLDKAALRAGADETGGSMSNEDAAKLLARMHLRLVKQSEAVHRKRKLKPGERAMWLGDLRADRLALARAFRALTGRDLTRE